MLLLYCSTYTDTFPFFYGSVPRCMPNTSQGLTRHRWGKVKMSSKTLRITLQRLKSSHKHTHTLTTGFGLVEFLVKIVSINLKTVQNQVPSFT